MAQQKVLPRFEVEALEGEVEETRYIKTEKGLEKTTVTVPAGWMVYFPFGHSIRIATEAAMKRLGFHRRPGKVDMAEGEVIEEDEEDQPSLKQISQRSTQQRPRRASSVEG